MDTVRFRRTKRWPLATISFDEFLSGALALNHYVKLARPHATTKARFYQTAEQYGASKVSVDDQDVQAILGTCKTCDLDQLTETEWTKSFKIEAIFADRTREKHFLIVMTCDLLLDRRSIRYYSHGVEEWLLGKAVNLFYRPNLTYSVGADSRRPSEFNWAAAKRANGIEDPTVI